MVLRRRETCDGCRKHVARSDPARRGPMPECARGAGGGPARGGPTEGSGEPRPRGRDRQPQDASRRSRPLVTILLSRGRAQDAHAVHPAQRAESPHEQGWIAYEATAARVLDRCRSIAKLYDYDRLVRTYDLEAPPGWSSMQELNARVAGGPECSAIPSRITRSIRACATAARRRAAWSPIPTRRSRPITADLRSADPEYRASSAAMRHIRSRRATWRLPRIGEAWSVQLRREGFHVNHVHPQGWISSAYYVSVPEEVRDPNLMSGWLKFGEPRYPVPGRRPRRAWSSRAPAAWCCSLHICGTARTRFTAASRARRLRSTPYPR